MPTHGELLFPDAEDEIEDDETGGNGSGQADPNEELIARINALETQQIERREDARMRLIDQSAFDTPTWREPRFVEVPDPVTDPEAFKRAQSENQRIADDTRTYNENLARDAQNKRQTAQTELWERFQSRYPEYAEDSEKALIATKQVLEKAKARGINTDRYMFITGDLFMDDVKDQMDKFGWGSKGSTKNDDDGDDDYVQKPRDAHRTGGIGGGTRRAASSGKAKEEKLGSLADDIRAWQRKTGFHS